MSDEPTTFTYKLKGARWLRKYTAPSASPVYAAASDAQNIADTLCDVPWTRADSDGPAMFPQHDAKALDANPGNRDLFDAAAFCAEHVNGAHKVYANAAFYLFALPSAAQGKTLSSVKVHLASDPYNEFGARVAVHLLSSPALPTDCGTVRTGVAHVDGQMPRTVQTVDGVAYWYGASGDVTVTLLQNSVTTAYLGVFVGLENYARARGDWIEGASYIRNSVEIETTEEITGWASGSTETIDCSDKGPAVLLAGGSSPTWLQPLPTVYAGATPPTLSDIVETFFTEQETRVTPITNNLELGEVYETKWVRIGCIGTTITSVSVWDWHGSWRACTLQGGVWSTGAYYVGPGRYTQLVSCGYYDGINSDGYARIKCTSTIYHGDFEDRVISLDTTSDDNVIHVQSVESYYLMLQLANGVPSDMDKSSTPSGSGRQNLPSVVSGSESPWTITLGGQEYTVAISGSAVTLKLGSQTLGAWTSIYDPGDTTAFDVSANLRFPGAAAHEAVADYGLAAAVGDFSSAVATFEAGTQPANAELLGRLARMSRQSAGAMSYLHPAAGALADELDALRPVPRFFRAETSPQSPCQPGLSAWYYRPATGSTAEAALAYRDGAVSVVSVDEPVFLQLALLALRSPSAFGSKIVLKNVGGSAVPNAFKIRFVAWVSPADEWDRSNSFAMAAMASMPSIYRSDGDGSVSWSVDCSGTLAPFGTRAMSARRIGVSEIVDGNIAVNGEVDISLTGEVKAGDVVLIAPEVLGFEDGTGAASVHFGRQADPAGTGEDSAASHNYAWARYPENLGWFPRVTGE